MDARDALTMWVRDGLLPPDLAERLRETVDEAVDERNDEPLESGEPIEPRPGGGS